MKYFLVFILFYLSLAHDAESMATDPPLRSATKGKNTPTTPKPSGDTPNSSSTSDSKKDFSVSNTACKFMATIRENPSEMYLCSAVFIAKDALLTTARCLIGRDTDSLFVHSNSSNLETEGLGNLAVKNVYLHPDFEMSPLTMDFGLIKLKKPDNSIIPVSLPFGKIWEPGTVGMTYTWRFTPNSDKFVIHERQSKIISNAKCYLIEQEVIPDNMVCGEGLPFQAGHFDNGMPFIINQKGKNYLLGLNKIAGKLETNILDKVWKIDGILPWITETLAGDMLKGKKPLASQKPKILADQEDEDDYVEEEDDEEEDDKGYIEQSMPHSQPSSIAVKNKKLRPNQW